ALRIHHDDGAGVMAQGVDCGPANIQILTGSSVPGDIFRHFIAHAFIDRSLTSDSSRARSFCPATRLFSCTPMPGIEAPHLGSEFPLAQFAARALLQLGNIRGAVSGIS